MANEEVLEAVRSLTPVLRERGPEGEQLRRLPDATVKEMKETGFARLLQPRRYGGFEADPRLFYEAVLAMAAADGSAGWVSGVVGVHPWQIAHWDDKVQAEIWGDDPDTWVSSSYMPGGMLRPADGGFRLTGRWSFSSGSDHCQWVILGSPVADDDGKVVGQRNTLLRRGEYAVEDVWDTVGLRGTGSNDIVVDDVFVPENRSMRVADLAALDCPGRAVNTGPLFACPWGAIFLNAVCAPLVGMAGAALELAVEYQRRWLAPEAPPGSLHPVTLVRLAEASSEIDAARLQLFANLADVWQDARGGDGVPLDVRARARRDQVIAVRRSLSAVDKAYESAGPRAIALGNPIQRFWRDAHAGAHHVVNLPDVGLSAYGRYLVSGRMEDPLV